MTSEAEDSSLDDMDIWGSSDDEGIGDLLDLENHDDQDNMML